MKVSSPGEEASPGNAKESEEGAPSAGEEVSTIGQLVISSVFNLFFLFLRSR